MESLIILGIIVAIVAIVVTLKSKSSSREIKISKSPYIYTPRSYVMTDAEAYFYKRLQAVAKGKYLVFPQIHLSSLAINVTPGKYRKAGFQRINRRSIDYVLVDEETLQPVYAVELDDRTHDTEKGKAIDTLKSEILQQINLPLVRFRNPASLTDEDIVRVFETKARATQI